MTTVAVSGGFDPVHKGHIELFKKARALGDKLIVILNNDNWLKLKKGHPFMDEQGRKAVIESIRYVDEVMLTEHPENTADMSVCNELLKIKPDIFANGGDRKHDNIPEYVLCEQNGIKMVFNLGEKIESSSWLINKVKKQST